MAATPRAAPAGPDRAGAAAAGRYRRPPDLAYSVDENPPPLRRQLIGLQYAVITAIYLVRLSCAA